MCAHAPASAQHTQAHPTPGRQAKVVKRAREIINSECVKLASSPSPSVLVLECVKEFQDAISVLELLKLHDLPLLQVGEGEGKGLHFQAADKTSVSTPT